MLTKSRQEQTKQVFLEAPLDLGWTFGSGEFSHHMITKYRFSCNCFIIDGPNCPNERYMLLWIKSFNYYNLTVCQNEILSSFVMWNCKVCQKLLTRSFAYVHTQIHYYQIHQYISYCTYSECHNVNRYNEMFSLFRLLGRYVRCFQSF